MKVTITVALAFMILSILASFIKNPVNDGITLFGRIMRLVLATISIIFIWVM